MHKKRDQELGHCRSKQKQRRESDAKVGKEKNGPHTMEGVGKDGLPVHE